METKVTRGVEVNKLLAAAVSCPDATLSVTVEHEAGLEAFLSDDPVDQRVLIACSDPSWPVAVPPSMIVNTEADWKRRAGVIVNAYLNQSLTGKKFLDFGCGNGAVAHAAADAGASVAVGYDVVDAPSWASGGNAKLTTDWNEVLANGPYDVLLMFDVFDHMDKNTQIEHCLKAASAVARGGTIYFRGHPWSSRHGGHIYRRLNKAFVHLMLTPGLVEKLSEDRPPTMRLLYRPGYENFWRQHIPGVSVASVDIIDTPVESIISENRTWMDLIWDRTFKANEARDIIKPTLRDHLTAEFVDLVIRKH